MNSLGYMIGYFLAYLPAIGFLYNKKLGLVLGAIIYIPFIVYILFK